MEVTKNRALADRRLFLIRGINSGNISEEAAQPELEEIEKKMALNLHEALQELNTQLQQEIKEGKKDLVRDGDSKRFVAKKLIAFMEQFMTKDEMKGVFRQGYKIMRGRE